MNANAIISKANRYEGIVKWKLRRWMLIFPLLNKWHAETNANAVISKPKYEINFDVMFDLALDNFLITYEEYNSPWITMKIEANNKPIANNIYELTLIAIALYKNVKPNKTPKVAISFLFILNFLLYSLTIELVTKVTKVFNPEITPIIIKGVFKI